MSTSEYITIAPRMKDLTGQTFGRLTALGYLGKDKFGRSLWEFQCTCGNKTTIYGTRVSKGYTKSCGCLFLETVTKHGRSYERSNTYATWADMKSRCLNPNTPGYHSYGSRGISVCERWMDYASFHADMGDRPAGCSLDRIDNDGNYEPSNCRWATKIEQANNRRSNRDITFDGKTMNVTQWAEHLGMKPGTLHTRITTYGWPIEKALTTPVKKRPSDAGLLSLIDPDA